MKITVVSTFTLLACFLLDNGLAHGSNLNRADRTQFRISALEELRAELKQTEKKLTNLLGKCSITYNGKCFWGIFVGGQSISRLQASALCEEMGGSLAGVYSQDHLDKLIVLALPYAATKLQENLTMWTGMVYETGRLKQKDGSAGPLLKWRAGHPAWRNSINRIVIYVDLQRQNGGIQNVNTEWKYYGTFCEIDI